MASERITLTVPGPDGDREVGLSSPNRVLWPALGITKHELAEYVLAVSGPFLEANGHWGDAAEKLYVHRHTLRYRMKRVEEITGRDLDLSQDRMEFWLALKARELIDQAKKGKGGREG